MVWNVVAMVAGAMGLSIWGWIKRDKIVEAWDSLVVALKGKKVAVLGARGSGKTTLLTFLSKGELPVGNNQTTSAKRVASSRLKLKDLQLDLKETKDLPGGEAAIQQWRELHDASDYVIYLIKAHEMDIDRVTYDLKLISEWQESHKNKPKLLLVATHMDLDRGFVLLQGGEQGDFHDRFVARIQRSLSSFKYMPALCLGGLNNKSNTESLVIKIIGWMQNA
ncbi:GTPase domain-containing protein [Pseudomonas atacamensis]|uniref:GTPase domain-containing protein n=1 Tax=Pseudomonas atacamensis TaxID=2565368 RepID=UPI001FAD06B1|nr:GTPase domain-containing protein [Pseudomonas atacamensis]MCI9877252.1 GTPase domain-containing protein [Pseudomonas atacamensis]